MRTVKKWVYYHSIYVIIKLTNDKGEVIVISYAPLRNLLDAMGLMSLTKFEQAFSLSSDVYYKIVKDEPLMLSTVETLCKALNQPIESVVAILDVDSTVISQKGNRVVETVLIDEKTIENAQIAKLEKEVQELRTLNTQLEASLAAERKSVNIGMPDSTLGQRVSYKRTECKVSVSELAALIGSNTVTIYKLEDGSNTNPTLQTIIKLCGVFRCSLNWLATGVE